MEVAMQWNRLTIALILVALVAGCGPSSTARLEENKDLVRRFTAAINEANWDAFDELLTEDFRRHSQATAGVRVNSREEFKQLQDSFFATMPDQHLHIEILIAEGDKVGSLGTYSGTQTGPMGDFPVTGKSMEIDFLSVFRIEEGRIAELWVEWDNLAMLAQLGLYPPPE
jgi:steroid delta-isomerase-like uncharacterized protein